MEKTKIMKGYDIQLVEAVTCGWVNGYQDHGPKKTEFQFNENVHLYVEIDGDLYGKYVVLELYNKGKYCWQTEGMLTQRDGTYIDISFTGIVLNFLFKKGTKNFKILLDENPLGTSNDFMVYPAPCGYYVTQDECIRHGCYWVNGACQATPP